MIEMKKKAIGGIKSMLEGRLAGRMRPKAEETAPEPGPDVQGEEEEGAAGAAAMPPELPHDDEGGEPDTSSLTPEEMETLKALLAKMG